MTEPADTDRTPAGVDGDAGVGPHPVPGPPPASGEGEGRIRVVGTAHVSRDSVDEVERTIREERPDVVAVELDEGRYRQLKGETPEDLDASDLLRGNTVFQFLAYWLLSYVQARLGDRFDVTPGADMMAAVDAAEDLGLGVALVDREIQTTIQRFWKRLTGIEKLKLLGGLAFGVTDGVSLGVAVGLTFGIGGGLVAEGLAGPFLLPAGSPLPGSVPLLSAVGGLLVFLADALAVGVGAGLVLGAVLAVAFTRFAPDEEEVEELDMAELTDTDVVSAMMEEFRRFSPGGAEALIDERDAYIAHRLVALREAGYRVVAVVGAGHREGIEEYLAHPERLPPMETLVGRETGRRFSVYKAFGYLFTLGFLAFFVLLVLGGARQAWLLEVFALWFAVNAVIAAALARLAGAHWPSAGVGGAVAWLTSVNPLLAPGWFAGYVELRYIDVNVGDINELNEILGDEEAPIRDLLARLRAVPLFRLIMIVALTNVGSFIASVLFATVLLPYLSADVGGVDGIARLMIRGARNGASLVWGAVA